MNKLKNDYHFFATITILCWAPTYVLTRPAMEYFSAFSLGFWRYFIASILLLFVVLICKIKPPKIHDLPAFILSGALGFGLYMYIFNTGSAMVSSAMGSVIIATTPAITALIAQIALKEKLSKRQWIAICIEFSGILVLMIEPESLSINQGVLWLLLAASMLSCYNISQRLLTKSYASLQCSIYSIFLGTLMLSVFAPQSIRELQTAPSRIILYVLFMGIFASGIAYVSWSAAFARAEKTSYVSNYMFLTPFLATLLGYLLAHETLDIQTAIGGSIIMAGVYLFNSHTKKTA